MNGKGRKGKGVQTSTVEHYLRQHHSTRRKFCNRFSELFEASAVKPKVVKRVHLEVLKSESSRTILNLLKFVNQLLRNP